MNNPYAPPQAPLQPGPPDTLSEGTCPSCHSADVHKPSFTWWGGALGPKLFNHTVCRACGLGFNWKTGKSNKTGIAIYIGVTTTLAIVLLVLFTQR
jgi:hypothetical protein